MHLYTDKSISISLSAGVITLITSENSVFLMKSINISPSPASIKFLHIFILNNVKYNILHY